MEEKYVKVSNDHSEWYSIVIITALKILKVLKTDLPSQSF
jgi:hypothetical protein